MSVLRPRNRLVNFRLNQEEYETLKAACSSNGARSISDFARSAVMRSVGAGEPGEGLILVRLSKVGHRISELESRIRNLLRLLEGVAGQAAADRSDDGGVG